MIFLSSVYLLLREIHYRSGRSVKIKSIKTPLLSLLLCLHLRLCLNYESLESVVSVCKLTYLQDEKE